MLNELKPISVGDITISPDKNFYIAGPCAIESEEQANEIADNVIPAGADAFRGGVFKPRTNINSFQGLREGGLPTLFNVGRRHGVPIVTEVMREEQVEVIRKASRGHPFIYQVGERNAQNFDLLRKVGETGYPVILKRGKGNTVSEIIKAAEYITTGGSPAIISERGIVTFSSAAGVGKHTLDILSVAYFQEAGFLVILDPSHAAKERRFVWRLGLAGIAAGANGLLTEVGIIDENGVCHAQCDAGHAMSFQDFKTMIQVGKSFEQIMRANLLLKQNVDINSMLKVNV